MDAPAKKARPAKKRDQSDATEAEEVFWKKVLEHEQFEGSISDYMTATAGKTATKILKEITKGMKAYRCRMHPPAAADAAAAACGAADGERMQMPLTPSWGRAKQALAQVGVDAQENKKFHSSTTMGKTSYDGKSGFFLKIDIKSAVVKPGQDVRVTLPALEALRSVFLPQVWDGARRAWTDGFGLQQFVDAKAKEIDSLGFPSWAPPEVFPQVGLASHGAAQFGMVPGQSEEIITSQWPAPTDWDAIGKIAANDKLPRGQSIFRHMKEPMDGWTVVVHQQAAGTIERRVRLLALCGFAYLSSLADLAVDKFSL